MTLTSSKPDCATRMTRKYGDRLSREETAILTKDEDFAARRLREPHGPTIIWLRCRLVTCTVCQLAKALRCRNR